MPERHRVLVVHRRSAYAELVGRGAECSAVDLEQRDNSLVRPLVAAHEAHEESMEIVRRDLGRLPIDATWVHDLALVVPDEFDLVLTIGGDGTVLHASHAIGSTPVLGINSSPASSVGYLTAGTAIQAAGLVERAVTGALPLQRLHRMEVRVGGRVLTSRALNDVLVCHDCPASTSRYEIRLGDRAERQTSSGVWVSTAAGSTAAIRAAGGKVMRAGSRRLQFVVREPFLRERAGAAAEPGLASGFVAPGQVLEMLSLGGDTRLFVDGPHVVFPLPFGERVTFSGSAEPLSLAGYRHRRNASG